MSFPHFTWPTLDPEIGRYLPRIEHSRPSVTTRTRSTELRGGETVLLVDDEDAVRALSHHVLAGCGFQVLEAAHAEEALRLAAAHPGTIDLLAVDVILPRISGRDLATRLTALHPSMRVLYLSGYGREDLVGLGLGGADVPFLPKPFSPAALSRKVREILDG